VLTGLTFVAVSVDAAKRVGHTHADNQIFNIDVGVTIFAVIVQLYQLVDGYL
jgi:hypothetical protein